MVQVEDNQTSSSHDGSPPLHPAAASTPPPAPPPPQEQANNNKPSASAVLAQCLKLLKGQSDEHKFAGLVMVTKHVPARTASESVRADSSSSTSASAGGGELRQICNAVGPAFLHRLLRTPGDKSSGGGSGGDRGGADVGGLSVYQQIALGVLAALFQDESLVPKFIPIAPALVRALRAANAAMQTQGLCDALYCTQAIAGVPGGMERLLRAGAAPAVVSRLSAASGERAARANEEKDPGGDRSGGGGAGVEESKAGGPPPPPPGEDGRAAADATPSVGSRSSSAAGLGGGGGGGGGGDPKDDGHRGPAGGDTPAAAAERSEALALAFMGRALEASGGGCLGSRELTAVAEAFRDDPTPAKFGFLDLLLRWASLREEESALFPAGGDGGVVAWARDGPFPAALREGLLQALHGAAEDDRRDSALALLASLLRAVGQEWAVEEDGEEADNGDDGGGKTGADEHQRSSNGVKKKKKRVAKRKQGTFVAFAVRCAAGEVRILLDEALSLFVPAAARGGARASDGDEDAGPGGGGEEEGRDGGGESSKNRWEELPIDTLQDLQKTLAGLFGCVLDFLSEIRRWVLAVSHSTGGDADSGSASAGPSIVDLWALHRLGLECSRVLGVWVAEDPESLPQRFLEALPVLLALNAGEEAPDSDDEESDDDADNDDDTSANVTPTLAAFPGAARHLAGGARAGHAASVSSATRPDEALHNILRAMLALSYEPTPLAAMVEEGVTARLARLAAAGPPAIAALLLLGRTSSSADDDGRAGGGGGGELPTSPPEQMSEAVRSPLVSACGLLTNILTSAGHLAWPEHRPAAAGSGGGGGGSGSGGGGAARRRGTGSQQPRGAPSHPVLGHPSMGQCLASLAEVAGAAGAARRAGGGARWRLLAAHATLVVMTVARAATPGNGLAPAAGLTGRRPRRWSGEEGDAPGDGASPSVWEGMARAVDEALGSLSATPRRGLIGGGRGGEEEEEASYEEGSIWQWCLECAREIEAAPGGTAGNAYVSCGVVPRRVLRSLKEASADCRI
ncbi:unnamed protein product [Ectocarpus sp. 12 AP-2014]